MLHFYVSARNTLDGDKRHSSQNTPLPYLFLWKKCQGGSFSTYLKRKATDERGFLDSSKKGVVYYWVFHLNDQVD